MEEKKGASTSNYKIRCIPMILKNHKVNRKSD